MAKVLADILSGQRPWPWHKGDPTTGPRECMPYDVTALDPIRRRQAHVKGAKSLFLVTTRALPARRNSFLGHLMDLPQELWLEILSYLDFGEMLRLRRTCKTIRYSVSKPTIQFLIPHWRRARWSTCTVCLRYSPAHTRVFYETTADGGTNYLPEEPECVECIAQRNGFRVGSRYFMGRHGAVSICRYCGQPIVTAPALSNDEFHLQCHKRHLGNMTRDVHYFGLYFMFFSVTTYICIWSDPRGSGIVAMLSMLFAITTLDGVMMVINRKGLCSRRLRLYHFYALLNLFAGGYCLYIVVMDYAGHYSLHRRKWAQLWAAYFFICISALWRIVHGLGNLILMFEYKFWQHHKPRRSWLRRGLSAVVKQLALIGDPECVLLEYPPMYGVECMKRRRG